MTLAKLSENAYLCKQALFATFANNFGNVDYQSLFNRIVELEKQGLQTEEIEKALGFELIYTTDLQNSELSIADFLASKHNEYRELLKGYRNDVVDEPVSETGKTHNYWELLTQFAIKRYFDCYKTDVIGEGKQFPNYTSFYNFLKHEENYLKFCAEQDFTPHDDCKELIAKGNASDILYKEVTNIKWLFNLLKDDLLKIGLTPKLKAYFEC